MYILEVYRHNWFDAIHTFSFETASAILLVSFKNRALDTSPRAAKHLQKHLRWERANKYKQHHMAYHFTFDRQCCNKSWHLDWTALIGHDQMTKSEIKQTGSRKSIQAIPSFAFSLTVRALFLCMLYCRWAYS